MSSTSNEVSFSDLLSNIHLTINKIGAGAFMEKMQQLQLIEKIKEIQDDPILKDEEEIAAMVVAVTCEEFGFTPYELCHGTGRKDNRKHAIGIVAAVLMQIDDTQTISKIAKLLKRDRANISRHRSEVYQYKETHPAEKPIVEKLRRVQEKIYIYYYGTRDNKRIK